MYVYKLTVLYIDRNIYGIFSFMYVEQFYNKKKIVTSGIFFLLQPSNLRKIRKLVWKDRER